MSNEEEDKKINNKNIKNESDDIPEYMKLYPEYETVILKKTIKRQKTQKKKNVENDEKSETYEINEKFLENIVKKPCPLSRAKTLNTLSKLIESSNLANKLLSEYHSDKKDKKINSSHLCHIFSNNLNYSLLEQNSILYRIGDNDNRLFYILSGRIQLLKLKELFAIKMTNLEYLNYCKYLYSIKEMYILNEVINSNNKILPFMSEEEVLQVSKFYFINELFEKLNRRIISSNSILTKFFHSNGYSFEEFDIKTTELNNIEQKRIKRFIGADQEWEDYIKEKCTPPENEQRFYEPFRILLNSKQKKNIICFVYENESVLEPNEYFGEISYDSCIKENKFTIRAQKDSVLAWIKNNEYLNIINPIRKLETMKEIFFLHNSFFFKEISCKFFEKNYYEYFLLHEYTRGTVLYSSGEKPKNLMFLKEGKLYIEVKCNIIDLFYLVKDLFENLISNPFLKELSSEQKATILPKETIDILKKMAYDNSLKDEIRNNPRTIDELKKEKKFQISNLSGNEILGIEEVFLNTTYIMRCVVNDNKASCYSFPVRNIYKILNQDHLVLFSFVKIASSKIISLIKRLDNIKTNCLNLTKEKYDYDLRMNENRNTEGNKYNSKNNLIEFNNIINNNKNNSSISMTKLKNFKTLYEKNANNKNIISKTETNTEFNNFTGNILSFDSGEPLNANKSFNSFYDEKSPLKQSIFCPNNFKEMINENKKFNKTGNMSHSSTKNYLFNDPILFKKNIFKSKNIKNKNKSNIFPYKNEDIKKNPFSINKIYNNKRVNNKSNDDNKNKKYLLIGKNKISIDNLKKNIDEFVSCDNSDKIVEIIQSNRINHNYSSNFYNHNIPQLNGYSDKINIFRKKNFHLSLVPLNKLNIYTDNNKHFEKSNSNYFNGKRTNGMKSITDFIGVGPDDNYIPTLKNEPNSILPKLNLKLGFFNKNSHSMIKEKIEKINQSSYKIQNRSSNKLLNREDGKNITKENFNDIKKKEYSSFIPNKSLNTIFMRKFHKKYQDSIKDKSS